MLNLKYYNENDDLMHHYFEFQKYLSIIQKNIDLKETLALDLCGGSGFNTGFLSNLGCKKVIAVDLVDYETHWVGEFKKKLSQLYLANEFDFDINKCQFIMMDAADLLFKDNLFDFVFCINAFEHVSDPKRVLCEIWRVLKPGGFAFIQFDPLYYCDTGGHMYDFIPEPWGHLLYSTDEYVNILYESGCPENIVNDFKYGLNRKPIGFFRNLFEKHCTLESQCFNMINTNSWSGVCDESHLSHDNFIELQKRYSKDDLLFRGMNILLQKRYS